MDKWAGSLKKHPHSTNEGYEETLVVQDGEVGAVLVRVEDQAILARRATGPAPKNVADMDYLQTHLSEGLGVFAWGTRGSVMNIHMKGRGSAISTERKPKGSWHGSDDQLLAEIWTFLKEMDGDIPPGPARWQRKKTNE